MGDIRGRGLLLTPGETPERRRRSAAVALCSPRALEKAVVENWYIGDETPHADADAETIGCAFYDSNTETSVTPEKRVVPRIHSLAMDDEQEAQTDHEDRGTPEE